MRPSEARRLKPAKRLFMIASESPAEQTSRAGVFRVLGVAIDAVQIPDVVAQMQRWILDGPASHFIAVTGMHGVTEAQHDSRFKQILNSADLVVPDGMPLVWLGRRRGRNLRRRVYGPELMLAFCQTTGSRYRHFFYGGLPGVAASLGDTLRKKYGIYIAGTYSPPFHLLSEDEDKAIIAKIHAAKPDVLWVGLSTPKQERWMYAHRRQLRVPVIVGVGAAFDLNSGRTRQAPPWMREHGFEWAFRLLQEPRRLWRRYLIYGSEFAWSVGLESLGLRRFD